MTTWILAAAEGEPDPLKPHLSEIIVGLIAFSLLFFFLKKFAFPMFEKAYAARTEAIEGGLARAEKAQAEADRNLQQYKQQLAEAREEAARIRTEAQSQRAEIVEEARNEARTEAQRITEQAQAQIASERQQVITELRREVGTLAVQLAGRVVGESLEDEARQRRTVERFLDELEDTANSSQSASQRPDGSDQQPAGTAS